MRVQGIGWLGSGLVVIGLALMAIGSLVGPGASIGGRQPWPPVFGPGPGGMMGSGGMMGHGGMMGSGSGPTAPAGTSVRMAGSRFEPATLTAAPGVTVRWFNDDGLPHTITAADGSWDSGNLAPGATFDREYDLPGTYLYLCRYHPGMTGTIVVAAP